MAERKPILTHSRSTHQGMNDKIEPWYLGENQAVLLQNLDCSRPGSRRRRLGTEDQGGLDKAPGGLWRAEDTTQNQEALFGIYDGNIFIFPGGGLLLQRASGISLTDALHAGIEGRWMTRPATYVVQTQRHDSGASLASTIVAITDSNQYSQCASMAPYCATWFQHRLWCAGNVLCENNETLWWSALDDGLSYSLTNTIQVEPGVGGRITGLLALRGDNPQLLIFKQRALCLLSPTWGTAGAMIPGAGDAFDTVHSNLTVLSNNVGCVASRSIQYIPGSNVGDIIFLSYEGFRAIKRSEQDVVQGASPPLSDPIQDTIDRINFAYAQKAVSAVVGIYYHCAVPLDGATTNTHILSLDLTNGSWYLNTWDARDLVTALLTETTLRLWMQSNLSTADCSTTGAFTGYHIFKCFSGYLDPGGAAIQFREDGRGMIPTGNIQDLCNWDWVGITLKNDAGATGALTVLYNIDNAGWVTAGSLTFEATGYEIYLGDSPLPWQMNATALVTKYLSLADAPPGYTIQIRYVSEDLFSQPSVLDVVVASLPVGPQIDNSQV